MNVVFDTLFYTAAAQAQINAGADRVKFYQPKFVEYRQCLFRLDRVESAIPSTTWKRHTEIIMESGDTWVLRISITDYFQLVDHIDAGKIICRLNN